MKTPARNKSIQQLVRFVSIAGIVVLAGWTAAASGVSGNSTLRFLSARTVDQRAFVQAFNQGDYAQALTKWSSAYGHSAQGNSTNGYALYSYLLHKNGMTYLALQHLFRLSHPEKIDAQIATLWRNEVPPQSLIWKVVTVPSSSRWRRIFPDVPSQWNLVPIEVKNLTQLAALKKRVTRANAGSMERTWLEWQLGLWLAYYNHNDEAKIIFRHLLNSNQKLISKDEIHINLARIDYQSGNFSDALAEYNHIKPASAEWLETLEEKSWTYVRMQKPGRALGQLQTLLTPLFASQVGPEPYFLDAFVKMKVCDYTGVFKAIKLFKERMHPRLAELQSLVKTGYTPQAEAALAKLENGPLVWESVGTESQSLPRYFLRDDVIRTQMLLRRAILHDMTIFNQIKSSHPSLLNGDGVVLAELQKVVDAANTEVVRTKSKITARMRVLASEDLAEIGQIIQKFHIVEAEVIERVHLQQSIAKRDAGSADTKSADNLVFPYTGEVWLDELNHYDVKVNGCPEQRGKTL